MPTRRDMPTVLPIATPCPVRWEEMAGEGCSRRCLRCGKRAMRLALNSAAAPVGPPTELHRRSDGTLLEGDCPLGVLHARRRRVHAVGRAALAAAAIVVVGLATDPGSRALGSCQPFRSLGSRRPAPVAAPAGNPVFLRYIQPAPRPRDPNEPIPRCGGVTP